MALNGNEFVIVPHCTKNTPTICKYNVANDQWTPMMPIRPYIPGAGFDPNTGMLYLPFLDKDEHGDVCRSYLQVIDTEEWKVRKCLDFSKMDIYHIVLTEDEIHCVYSDEEQVSCHFVANKVSGDIIQEPTEIHPDLFAVSKVMFFRTRSSIVLDASTSVDGQFGHMFVEYSLATKQWKVWKWASAFLKIFNCYGLGYVVTMDERYILSFGGHRNSKATDSIMIYDVDRKQCLESELKLPVKNFNWQALLMTDQTRGVLLTFGFVKRCYKAEEFRNMMRLPTALIRLIGRCFAMEYVHLILGIPDQGAHYRVNVHEILAHSALPTP